MILATDPSTTRFGLAIGGPNDGKPRAWTIKLPGADDHVFDRCLGSVYETISTTCRSFCVEIVAIEAPLIQKMQGSNAHTLAALVEVSGVIRAAAQRAGCKTLRIGSSTVRKMFVGRGFPDDPKQAVMQRCRLLGWDFSDDNAADAAATWAWAMSVTYPRWAPKSTPLFRTQVPA